MLGTSSIGSLREPTVMAVRSSKYSTGLMEDGGAHAPRRTTPRLAGIHSLRIHSSIPGRELRLIIQLPRPGILLVWTSDSAVFGRKLSGCVGRWRRPWVG